MEATMCAYCNCLVNGDDVIEMPEQWGDEVYVCSTTCARNMQHEADEEQELGSYMP